jgi:hypothetical protein
MRDVPAEGNRGRTASRRRFLGLAVASAVAAATPGTRQLHTTRPPIPAPVSRAVGPRFAGDPGSGRILYGASLPFNHPVGAFEQEVDRHLGVHRSYFSAGQVTELLETVRDDRAHYRASFVSIKLPAVWQHVASGASDVWLSGLLNSLADIGYPVMLCLHHEPEDDAGPTGMQAADWISMQSRAIAMSSSHSAITIVPILMQWTFDSRSGRNPNEWMVPQAKVFGLDVYNHWSQDNGMEWQTFANEVDLVAPWAQGKPILIAEHGCRDYPDEPGRAAQWMKDTYAYAQSHSIPVLSYFNSWQNSPDGTWELFGERLNAFRTLLDVSYDVHPV